MCLHNESWETENGETRELGIICKKLSRIILKNILWEEINEMFTFLFIIDDKVFKIKGKLDSVQGLCTVSGMYVYPAPLLNTPTIFKLDVQANYYSYNTMLITNHIKTILPRESETSRKQSDRDCKKVNKIFVEGSHAWRECSPHHRCHLLLVLSRMKSNPFFAWRVL